MKPWRSRVGRKSLQPPLSPSPARRAPAQARSDESRSAEQAFPTALDIAKEQGARSWGLARGARARQALPIDRPPLRRPRRPRARARRLCADPGNAGDRRGVGAPIATAVDRLRAMKPISCSPYKDTFGWTSVLPAATHVAPDSAHLRHPRRDPRCPLDVDSSRPLHAKSGHSRQG